MYIKKKSTFTNLKNLMMTWDLKQLVLGVKKKKNEWNSHKRQEEHPSHLQVHAWESCRGNNVPKGESGFH